MKHTFGCTIFSKSVIPPLLSFVKASFWIFSMFYHSLGMFPTGIAYSPVETGGGFAMKQLNQKMLLVFVIATLAGACMHFLYTIFPNPVTAVLSPVNESLWEHLKILFWPYLAASLYLTRGGEKGCRTPWLLTLVILCALMLGLGWLYHVVLGGDRLAVDIGLYVALMALGYLLPGLLHNTSSHPFVRDIAVLLVVVLAGAIIIFTFLPPDHVLFVDLSGVNTFARVPC